jgi:hypothetical protein
MEERELLKSREYRDGIIRANEHANFLEIPDVKSESNRIVKGYDTVLFDFNIIFAGYKWEDWLLKHYQENYGSQFKWFHKPWASSIIRDERKKIAKRVTNNPEKFFSLIRLMEDVPDCTKKTLRQKAALYAVNSMEELLRERVDEYSKS